MIGGILSSLVGAYMLVLFARIIFSWLPLLNIRLDRDNPLVKAIYSLTEPILLQIRQVMPQTGMFDFSVIILFILLSLLQRVFLSLPF